MRSAAKTANNDNAKPFMQRVYDGEIDVAIDWCWDGGFRIRLGNELSSFEAEALALTTWSDC
jgi:hypothetical protein